VVDRIKAQPMFEPGVLRCPWRVGRFRVVPFSDMASFYSTFGVTPEVVVDTLRRVHDQVRKVGWIRSGRTNVLLTYSDEMVAAFLGVGAPPGNLKKVFGVQLDMSHFTLGDGLVERRFGQVVALAPSVLERTASTLPVELRSIAGQIVLAHEFAHAFGVHPQRIAPLGVRWDQLHNWVATAREFAMRDPRRQETRDAEVARMGCDEHDHLLADLFADVLAFLVLWRDDLPSGYCRLFDDKIRTEARLRFGRATSKAMHATAKALAAELAATSNAPLASPET